MTVRDRVREVVDGLEPRPRLVDWSILALVAAEFASGVLSLGAGHPDTALLFWLHGILGLTLVALLFYKFRRVAVRVADPNRWDRATGLSVLTAAVAVAALATGVVWVLGGDVRVLFWTLLNVHIGLGLALAPLVLAHLWTRFRAPRRVDFEGRRTALQYGALLVAGALAWRAQDLATRALDTAGTSRRFTGSKPVEETALGRDTEREPTSDGAEAVGGEFPVTSWVADDPDPVDADEWELHVSGLVAEPYALGYDELGDRETRRALLDCTSGWYTVQEWGGVRVGDVLDRAGVDERARWVTFVSVTGYRWSLPLAEAREAVLATHVGGRPLSHGHGSPLRLVAPDRRGFQWVKWIDRVEVRRRRDPAQWIAVLVSGFTES